MRNKNCLPSVLHGCAELACLHAGYHEPWHVLEVSLNIHPSTSHTSKCEGLCDWISALVQGCCAIVWHPEQHSRPGRCWQLAAWLTPVLALGARWLPMLLLPNPSWA